MSLIEKVIKLLERKKEPVSNEELYQAFPEYRKEGIRGVISRYLGTEQEPKFQRIKDGLYAIIEVVKCEPLETGGTNLSYIASYDVEGQNITFFHKDYFVAENVTGGTYISEKTYNELEPMYDDIKSIAGIMAKADAREILSRLKSESFDLLLTDPPYKVISGGNKNSNAPKGMLKKNDGKIFEYNDITFDEYIPECYRILKQDTHAYFFTNFLNLQNLMEAVQRAGFKIHNLLAWIKNNATPNRWYMKNGEYVLLCYKGKAKSIRNCGSKTFHNCDNILGSKLHETEKPVDLLRMYIENSTNQGDWVCDPFAGSGSTMAASLLSGRRCFTSEIDEKYIPTIYQRIRNILVSGRDTRDLQTVGGL